MLEELRVFGSLVCDLGQAEGFELFGEKLDAVVFVDKSVQLGGDVGSVLVLGLFLLVLLDFEGVVVIFDQEGTVVLGD